MHFVHTHTNFFLMFEASPNCSGLPALKVMRVKEDGTKTVEDLLKVEGKLCLASVATRFDVQLVATNLAFKPPRVQHYFV